MARAAQSRNGTFETKALSALDRLPKLSPTVWDRQGVERYSGDQRRTPFKGSQNAGAGEMTVFLLDELKRVHGSIRSAVNSAPVKRVSFSRLHGLQAGVRKDIVEKKIREIAASDFTEAPSTVKYKGKLYLLDGYHSLTALKLGGVKAIEASVVSV
jgi:hypothetical protein